MSTSSEGSDFTWIATRADNKSIWFSFDNKDIVKNKLLADMGRLDWTINIMADKPENITSPCLRLTANGLYYPEWNETLCDQTTNRPVCQARGNRF